MKLVFTVSYWWFVCFSYPHLSPASGGFVPQTPWFVPPLSKFLVTPLVGGIHDRAGLS